MIDYLSLGVIVAATVLIVSVIFHFDRKQDARSAELRAEMRAVVAKIDSAITELRDRDDRNASDLRNEMYRGDDRLQEQINGVSNEQREHGKQIVRLEARSDAEPQSADDA